MSQTYLATCYFPDRSIDTLSVPCNNTAQGLGAASPCCRPHDACYESGACFQDWSGVMYRQSCTDPTFRDSACPQMCLGDGMLKDGVWILTCDMKGGKACCLTNDTSCCGSESSWFDFVPGYIKAVLNGDGSNRLGPNAGDGESLLTTSITTSISQTLTTFTGASFPTTSSDNTNSLTSSPTTANQLGDSLSSPGFSTAAIGATAGLGALFMISLMALIFIYLRRTKKKKQEKSSSEIQTAGELPGDMSQYELATTNELHGGDKVPNTWHIDR